MVNFKRAANGFYVTDPTAPILCGFLTAAGPEVELSLADAWQRAGCFVIGHRPDNTSLETFAHDVVSQLRSGIRIVWIHRNRYPVPAWTVSTTAPGAPCKVTDATRFTFRQVQIEVRIGTPVTISEDAILFATDNGHVRFDIAVDTDVVLGKTLSLLLFGPAAGTFQTTGAITEPHLQAVNEGVSYFQSELTRAATTSLTRTTFRVIRAPVTGIETELNICALEPTDHARTYFKPTAALLDSHLYLNQGSRLRLRPRNTARWVLGEDRQYLEVDDNAYYCLMPKGAFEAVRPADVKQLSTGNLVCGRSGSEYLQIALGAEVRTRAEDDRATLEFADHDAFIEGAPDQARDLSGKIRTVGLRIGERSYVAQHEQATLHRTDGQQRLLVFNELRLAPVDAGVTFPFAPFGSVHAEDPHAANWDANVLGPTRRRAFRVSAPRSSRAAVESVVATTPHGLLLETRDGPFAVSILAGPTLDAGLAKVELTGISTAFAEGVLREKVFAVVPNNDREACQAATLKLSIAGWHFDGALAPKTGDQHGIVLFKFFSGVSLRKLIGDPSQWTYPRQPPAFLLKALQTWVAAADRGDRGMFGEIQAILDNENWEGVILANFGVDTKHLPADIDGVVGTLTSLRAHHLSVQLNRVDQGNNTLAQSQPSLFGLISYDDPDSELKGSPFAFKVRELRVKFACSHVADFRCKADLRINELFFDPATLKNTDSGRPNVLVIEGRWEARTDENGQQKDVYVFVNDQTHVFDFSKNAVVPVLSSITITRTQLTTTKTGDQTKTRFALSGSIECKPVLGDFDPFGIDKVEFHDLGLLMIPRIDLPDLPDFHFDPSAIRLELTKLRGGLLASFPLRLRGLLFAGSSAGLDLGSLGFFPLSIGGISGPKLAFGFVFDVDLGLPGGFAPPGPSLTVQFVLGWIPKLGLDGLCFGFGLPSSANGRLELGLQGVLRLLADQVKIEKVDLPTGSAIVLRLVNTRLEILGTTLPPETDNPDERINGLFVVPPQIGTKVGWFVALKRDISLGNVFTLSYLGIGQRIKPKPTGSCIEVVEDFEDSVFKLDQAFAPGRYDAATGWTIATHMKSEALDGELQLAFSDPSLACLHLRLLKVFTLDITYRRVGDDVGVFSIDTKLPIGRMEFGAVSVGLPSIGVDVFTNGDFRVDVGFPRGTDFSRSCEVQAFPFIGSGGFYVGKLSGATSDLLHDSTGEIKRVLQVGVAARVGLGKSIEMGPLRAGLSVTVFGTLEGALGYRKIPFSLRSPTDLAIFARMGLIAEIYGSVDFGIIKASVAIRLSAEVGMSIVVRATHLDAITLYVAASVEVGVEVVIASFKIFGHRIEIKITFHFHADLRFQFDIVKASNRALRAGAPALEFVARRVVPENLPLPKLPLWMIADGTVTFGGRQRATCVVFAALPRTPMEHEEEARRAAPTAFDVLGELMLRWVLAIVDDARVITQEALSLLEAQFEDHDTLADLPEKPLVAATINDFIAKNFRVGFADRAGDGKEPGVFFPLLPDIKITATYAGARMWSNRDVPPQALDRAQRRALTGHFARLFAEHRATPAAVRAAGDAVPVTDLIYQDYFDALVKGVVREARDELKEKALPFGELVVALRKVRLPRLALTLSRFFLHGLQLPLAGITTPLFDALRQQFAFFGDAPAPDVPAGDYVVTFTRDADSCHDTVRVADNGAEGFGQLRALERAVVAPKLTPASTSELLFVVRKRTFALPHRVPWTRHAGQPEWNVHLLPAELAEYLDSEETAARPRPQITLERHALDADSRTQGDPIPVWSAGLRIDLVLEPVLDEHKTDTGIYRLVAGVKDDQRHALRQLLGSNGAGNATLALVRPDGAKLTSVDVAGAYLTRVDLTTKPKPARMRALPPAPIPDQAYFTEPEAVLRLLGEFFIVNSSGYLLVLPAALPGAGKGFAMSVVVALADERFIPRGSNVVLVPPDAGAAERTVIAIGDRADRYVPRFPAGSVAFEVARAGAGGTLDSLYNLVDYGWAETDKLSALSHTDSLPLGPEGQTWTYRQSLPLYGFAKHPLEPALTPGNRYSAAGERVNVTFGVRDIYGNRRAHSAAVEVQILYTDALVPVQALPGTHTSFTTAPNRSLVATMAFDPSALVPKDTPADHREEVIKRIEAQYTLALEQAVDPHLSIGLSSSLGATTAIAKSTVVTYLTCARQCIRSGEAYSASLATTVTPGADLATIDLALSYQRSAPLVADSVKYPESKFVVAPISPDLDALRATFEDHFNGLLLASHDDALYAIPDAYLAVKFAQPAPAYFALPPLSTTLLAANGVRWQDEQDREKTVDAVDVDLDAYALEMIEALEQMLQPSMYIAARRAGAAVDPAGLLDVKRRLATALSARVAAIYGAPDPTRASRSLSELMLEDLRATYSTSALVDIAPSESPARPGTFLYGDIVVSGDDARRCKAPNALLELAPNRALTIPLSVVAPEMSRVVTPALKFDVTHLGVAEPGDVRPARWYRLENRSQKPERFLRDIGASPISIPIPLRRMATAPTPAHHKWTPVPLAGSTKDRLKAGSQYDYVVEYDTIPADQDTVYLDVEYSAPIRTRGAAADSLLRALVAFHHSYAAVKPLLAKLVTEPADAGMKTALAVFVIAAKRVADAFDSTRARVTREAAPDKRRESYVIDHAGGVKRIAGDVASVVPESTRPSEDQAKSPWVRSKLTLGHIDVTQHDSARASLRLTRNEELLPKRAVNPVFIYTTQWSQFPTPVAPYIERPDDLDLSELAGVQPLEMHLKAVFSTVISEERLIDLRFTYHFGFSGSAGARGLTTRSPLHVLSITKIAPATAEELAATIAAQANATLRKMEPSRDGALRLSLRLHTVTGDRAVIYWDGLLIPLQLIKDLTTD